MEHETVPLERKIRWVEELLATGVDVIQLGSFVHPAKVPQMADTDRLFQHFRGKEKPPGVTFSALVLNEKGLERGLACGVELYCMGVSASDTHSRKNTGMSVAEATENIVGAAGKALAAGARVQVSVQSAFGCGFEGPVPQENVVKIVERYLAAGLRNISLADTAGHATPRSVEQLYRAVAALDDSVTLACHFHNTYGMAIANCWAALREGVVSFESALAGIGGCPFTKIAGGNVSTEDLVHMFQRMGLRSDIRLDRLIAAAQDMAAFFNREMPGTVYRTGAIPVHAGEGVSS
jgi:hydroxymethylglutaryl-CoA lyase